MQVQAFKMPIATSDLLDSVGNPCASTAADAVVPITARVAELVASPYARV